MTDRLEGGGRGMLTGREVLESICDLGSESLPRLANDDPVRPHLAAFSPQLAAGLGRSAVRSVQPPDEGAI